MSGLIVRLTANKELEALLRSAEDFEITTPLENFDNDEEDANMKKYEISIENNLEKSNTKDILNVSKKEIQKDGKANSTELERH